MTSRESGYYTPTSAKVILGDGIYDVNLNLGSSEYAWFADSSASAYSTYPFFLRGSSYYSDADAGVFYSYSNVGDSNSNVSFRIVMPGV